MTRVLHVLRLSHARAQTSKGYKFTKNLATSGIKWDTEAMYKWLENPKNMVKGTSMAFPGFKKETDRANVIAYLHSISADESEAKGEEKKKH